jgi:hypothetical protein
MQQPYLRLLEPHLEPLPQRDYILMASEGVIAIPMQDRVSGGVLATPFGFFEFIPEADAESRDPRVLLASELEVGERYVVLLSTSAGLYRYNIGDIVRVTGKAGRTPIVEFLHRSGSTCSMTGEKLTEEQVVGAVSAVAARLELPVEGFTLHPAPDGFPRYVLVIEPAGSPEVEYPGTPRPSGPGNLPTSERLRAFLHAVDGELGARNVEYSAKRSSERLGAPELWLAAEGSYELQRRRRVVAGANDGQIKPTHLTRDTRFSAEFEISKRITTA